MISVEELPRDENGTVQGAYRILHRTPTYRGPVGVYDLVDGASTEPACGRPLVVAVVEYGNDLYLEPWGDLPPGFLLPETVRPEVPEAARQRMQRCPWREASATADEATGESAEGAATSDGLDELDLEALQALVVELGLAPGNKQEKALRKLIRAERAKASATADEA